MFKWLRDRLTPRDDIPPAVVPGPKSVQAQTPPASTDYLRREPLLDREHRVCDYELNLDRPAMSRARHPAAQRFLDGALLDRVSSGGLAGVLDHRLAFLPIIPASLDLPQLDGLARTVARTAGKLVISLQAGALPPDVHTLPERLRELKGLGLRLAFDEALATAPSPRCCQRPITWWWTSRRAIRPA